MRPLKHINRRRKKADNKDIPLSAAPMVRKTHLDENKLIETRIEPIANGKK